MASRQTVDQQTVPAMVDLLTGVVIGTADLNKTRSFYERVFRGVPGEWREVPEGIVFTAGPQRIEFVRPGRRLAGPGIGQHQAYRVPAADLGELVDDLSRKGHTIDWWREDHPAEHQVAAYVLDPSGNRVQLVPSDGGLPLLDHVAIEVHQFDYCEAVYVHALGGRLDYYHGWRVEDEAEAAAWAAGDDPCAPWTRRNNPGWADFVRLGPAARDGVPRPNTQTFIRYGETRLCLISASKARQEPSPELLRGQPRQVFRLSRPAHEAAAHLRATLPLPIEHDGTSIFLRDPDGNFLELRESGPSSFEPAS